MRKTLCVAVLALLCLVFAAPISADPPGGGCPASSWCIQDCQDDCFAGLAACYNSCQWRPWIFYGTCLTNCETRLDNCLEDCECPLICFDDPF